MSRLRGNPWVVLISICLGFFMILLDLTIVNIAIPSMIDGLGASLDEVLWVVNAYVLVFAVLLITAGRLGDIVGPRRMFLSGLVVFTIASALCGVAQNPTQLILARVLQGVGGAMLTPQTLTILTTIFPPEKRGAAFGVWGAVAGVATVAGPTLGGLLVTKFDWPWIFFINVPVGIFTFIMAMVVIPDMRPGRKHRLDLTGTVLATLGLFGIVFGLTEGERFSWGQVWSFVSIPLILALGALFLLLFVFHQWRRQDREPLLPFQVFADRNFSLMNLVGAAVSFGMLGLFLPLTIYLQSVLGLTALQAGLTFLPMSVMSMLIAPFAGRLSDRIGGKYILITGLSLFAIGMGLVDLVSKTDSTRTSFLAPLIVAGIGLGCLFAPMATVAMRDVKPQIAGAASGVLNTTRQLGGVIGSAAVGAVLQNRLAASLHDEARSRAQALPEQVRGGFVAGFDKAAKSGLQVGRGQTGSASDVPKGVPAEIIARIQQIAHDVFVNAFVNAMRPTLLVPILVLAVAAVSCVFIRNRPIAAAPPATGRPPAGEEEPVPVA